MFIVGQLKETGPSWEFTGVFDTEEKAVAACTTGYHFMGPVKLNELFPYNTVKWPDAHYPKNLSVEQYEALNEVFK